MAVKVASSQSLVLSSLLFLVLLSLIQVTSSPLASSELFTILGGFLCSLLFVFALIAIGNIEQILLGDNTTTGWFEVGFALFMGMTIGASVHRVCVTTCFLFSCGILYLLNNVSASVYNAAPARK
eukprot:GILI01062724.1.p1 GENE.GILI01062724.1~~GILI01062724.1.p1  ORF type:complete len:140 (+),score=30.90 GILI01062724.1:46-420(+)